MAERADRHRRRGLIERPILQWRLLRRPADTDRPSEFSDPYPGDPDPPGSGRLLAALLAPPTDPRLDRTADRIGSFIALLAVFMTLWSAIFQWAEGQLTPRDTLLLWASVPLTLVTACCARLNLRRNRSARPALLVHTLVCFLQLIITMPLWQAGPGQPVPPPAFTVELGAAAAWACLSIPVAIADIIITGVIVVVSMHGSSQDLSTVGGATVLALLGAVFTFSWQAIVAVVATSRRAGEASWRSSANLVAAREAEAASNHWDGLIHDCVLNALGAAARLPPEAQPSDPADPAGQHNDRLHNDRLHHDQLERSVRALACDALSALHRSGGSDGHGDVAAQLAGCAATLGLHVEWDVTGTPPPAIRDQIVRAGKEALTNVARHSGTTRARVVGRFNDHRASLEIQDGGRGFDPGQVPEARRGLRTSIVEAMRARGGRAEVRSAPGRGTTVSLTWQTPDIAELNYSQLRFFGPVVGLLVLLLIVMLVLGISHTGDVAVPGLQIACTALMVGATIAAMAWPRLHRWMLVTIPGVVIACQVAMLTNLQQRTAGVWEEWFLGFGLGMYSALAWRTGSGIWLRVSLLSWPVVTVIAALFAGADPVIMLVSHAPAFMWPTIIAMAAAWASNSLYGSLATIRSSRDAALDATRLQARAEASRREADRRLATIEGAPMDMLVHLAAGEPITDEVRRECRLLEASTRDLLVAPFVVSTAMSLCFRAARERDAIVSITGTDTVQTDAPCTGAAEAFRQVCVILADAAGPGARLTCRWHPRSAISRATVALSRIEDGDGAGGDEAGRDRPDSADSWRDTAVIGGGPVARLQRLRTSARADVDIMDEGPDILTTIS